LVVVAVSQKSVCLNVLRDEAFWSTKNKCTCLRPIGTLPKSPDFDSIRRRGRKLDHILVGNRDVVHPKTPIGRLAIVADCKNLG